jgi:hypothetical protein
MFGEASPGEARRIKPLDRSVPLTTVHLPMPRMRASVRAAMSLRGIHLVGAILLARYITLETIGSVSDTPQGQPVCDDRLTS